VFTTSGRLEASGDKAILCIDKKTVLNASERDYTLGYATDRNKTEGQEP
jgi:hypothetical protein